LRRKSLPEGALGCGVLGGPGEAKPVPAEPAPPRCGTCTPSTGGTLYLHGLCAGSVRFARL